MGAIVLKSKQKVTNLDSLENADAFARCLLSSFDILTYRYRIEYQAELERTDFEGNPTIKIQPLATTNGKFSPAEIQNLFDATGKDIAQGENFDTEMRDIITTALIYKIVQDGRFGLQISDWEVIS